MCPNEYDTKISIIDGVHKSMNYMQKSRFITDFLGLKIFCSRYMSQHSLFIHTKTMNLEMFNQVYNYLCIFLYTCIFGAIMKWAHNFMHGKDFAAYNQIVMVVCPIYISIKDQIILFYEMNNTITIFGDVHGHESRMQSI